MDEAQKNELRKMLTELMNQPGAQKPAGMGFDQKLYDKVMSDPEAMQAGAEMAGLMNDSTALGMMSKAGDFNVPNGGQLGWTEALSKGIDKGIGTYNLLNAQKVKANALRSLAPKGGSAAVVEAVAPADPNATAYPIEFSNPVARPLA